jgi:hypothetical protein
MCRCDKAEFAWLTTVGYSQGKYKTDSQTGGVLFALHSIGEDKPAKIWNTARWLNY